MLLLMQGSIFIDVSVPLFPSASALDELLLRARHHVVYVAWNQVMVVYELVAQSSVTMLLGWLEVHPHVRYLKYYDHFVPNQLSICNEQVVEWSDSSRVSPKHRRPTKN